MHIGHKSKSSPQWIWSTFEQVDNLDVDPVAHPKLKPSFFDPDCPICVPNQEPSKNNNGEWQTSPKTQAVRAIPIPNDKRDLNVEAQSVFAKFGSPLQYYQLIDTQWPTDPAAAPTPWTAELPGADHQQAWRESNSSLPDQHHHGDLLPEGCSVGLPARGSAEQRPHVRRTRRL